MSSLLSLKLSGIRSFGPNEDDAGRIEILSPVTLILGQNGCGKTTLIESLKFAACAELPDLTNKGSCFLNDPNLADSNITRGFVKLRFKGIEGDIYEISRKMKVTQNLDSLEFKRANSTLSIINSDDKNISLNIRGVELNNLVTLQMGVSKAILTNVIFCHQEDSSWPLDEGKKVKERFDAIFNLEKYNSNLEKIKQMRKNSLAKLEKYKKELETSLEWKNEADNKRERLTETVSVLNISHDRVKALEEKLVSITINLQDIAEKEENIVKFQTEFKTLNTRLSSVQENIVELKKRIQHEFSGSNEELESAVNNFQLEVSNKEEVLCKLENELKTIDSEIEKCESELNEEQKNVSLLTQDFGLYRQRLEDRNENIVILCRGFQIDDNISKSQLSENNIELEKQISLIEETILIKQKNIKNMKSENEDVYCKLEEKINIIKEEKGTIESTIFHKNQQVTIVGKDCDKLTKNIEKTNIFVESTDKLQSELEKINRALNELNLNNDIDKMKSNIEEKKCERGKLEGDLSIIEEEVQTIQEWRNLKKEIDVQKQTKAYKEEGIKKILDCHKDSLIKLLGKVPGQGLKANFESYLTDLRQEINTKKESIKAAEGEMLKFKAEKKRLADKLRIARQNLTFNENLINEECKNKDYNSYCDELSNEVKKFQDRKGTVSCSEFIYKEYVKKLKEEDPCCPLCHRNFKNEEDIDSLIEELILKIRELPSKFQSYNEKLNESQKKYETLLQLKPKYDDLLNIRKVEIPLLQSDLEKTKQKLEEGQQSLDKLHQQLSVPLNNEKLAESIKEDIILLEQHWNDIRRLDVEIEKLEAKFSPGNGKFNLEEVMSKKELLQSKVTSSRQELEVLLAELSSVTSSKQKLQENKHSHLSELMKIEANVQLRSQLAEKLKENENYLCSLQLEIEESAQALQGVKEKLEVSSQSMKTQMETKNKLLQDSVSNLKLTEERFKNIRHIQTLIHEYESAGAKEKLKLAEENLSTLKSLVSKLQGRKESIYVEKDNLKSDLASQKIRERDLEDNVKIRAKAVEEKELLERIKSLKFNIENMDAINLSVEKNKLQHEKENITSERAREKVTEKELESTVLSIESELCRDEYKNANNNYMDKLIQKEVELEVIEDLDKYYVGLDSALTLYHQEKMHAINSTIRDLWRKVYTGNDIDSIEVRADVNQNASADRRRTFNYRVVQINNGVEMNMRGRCSAGQRVLACIIIRIALAEIFSADCGMLALDDPTNNLDETNVNSFAEALIEIVTSKCSQKNFQLIIISHDKAFLEIFRRIGWSQNYYNVSRDWEGKSRITKVNPY